ncbi:EpsI family protein [Sphingomonas guangdongensis]|uniref:EpsI family protein n=1 Tax=Sphingomonas guangdongensis TaxID=1141890 RepID=A0A285QHX5_9SPHN|nr:exosortase-associated protein EpsI, V-type [Sphingomonas guangdongensis]SOB81084.1 EpsI family protein [Sphingomonas guangdongensis]
MTDAARPLPDAALDRRQFVLGGTLLAAAAATVVLKPKRVVAPLEPGLLNAAVPKRIGPYSFLTASGLVLPPQDEITEQIYDQVLTRVYAADGLLPLMLLIAYGSAQDYTLQAHLPEICYPSSGYTLTDLDRVPVQLGDTLQTATFLAAERAGTVEQVLYWVRIGAQYPSTLTGERLAVFRANVARTLPDGILVRVSTISPSRREALPQLQSFNRELISSINPLGRRLFFGPTSQ